MASNPVQQTKTAISPLFNIPEGVEELVYDNGAVNIPETDDATDYDSSFLDDIQPSDDSSESDTPYPVGLDVPKILGIVSQTIRTDAAGNQVIDVILLVEDVIGASDYETRKSIL